LLVRTDSRGARLRRPSQTHRHFSTILAVVNNRYSSDGSSAGTAPVLSGACLLLFREDFRVYSNKGAAKLYSAWTGGGARPYTSNASEPPCEVPAGNSLRSLCRVLVDARSLDSAREDRVWRNHLREKCLRHKVEKTSCGRSLILGLQRITRGDFLLCATSG
jgi:hypothetical protein